MSGVLLMTGQDRYLEERCSSGVTRFSGEDLEERCSSGVTCFPGKDLEGRFTLCATSLTGEEAPQVLRVSQEKKLHMCHVSPR